MSCQSSLHLYSPPDESEADVADRIAQLRSRQVPVAGEAVIDAMLAIVSAPEFTTGTTE